MLLVLQLLLFLTLSVRTDGYYHYITDECITSSSALSDAEYIETFYFNLDPIVQFSSTVGEYVGFNTVGVNIAEGWNSGTAVQQARARLENVCKPNLQIYFSNILEQSVKPKVKFMLQPAVHGFPAMLICSAYKFYPPAIDVYWLRDGEKVASDEVSSQKLANGDWYYQIHSGLNNMSKSGEKISCVVEHASSKEPIIYNWNGSSLQVDIPDKIKLAVGVAGLALGIVLSAAGFIYYKKKSRSEKVPAQLNAGVGDKVGGEVNKSSSF